MTSLPTWTEGVHHDGSALYVSNPLPTIGETITIRLRIPLNAPIKRVYMRARPDGEFRRIEMHITHRDVLSAWWSANFTVTQHRNDYCFKLIVDDGSFNYNALEISRAEAPDWFNFSLLADYEAPLWTRESVFYQIFPDRFNNGDPSNDVQDGQWERDGKKTHKRKWGEPPIPWMESRSMDFFGGDLQGIAQKLDYLRDLGVNALYLTPIFNAETNHFYDIKDYHNVAPHLGGNEGLAELRKALDQHNMFLMLDITPNHLGRNHPWFTDAMADHSGPTAEYFIYHQDTKSFEYWLGVPILIKLNYASQKLRDVMYRSPDSAIRHWLKEPYRIDGWRLDVANMTGNFGTNQLDKEVWREMRKAIKGDKRDAYMIGEYFQDGTPNIQGDQLDASMNYQGFNVPMRRWLGGHDLGVEEHMPFGDSTLMPTDAMALQWQHYLTAIPYVIALQQFNQLGSHDVARILTVTNGDKALAKLGAAMLVTFPGVPCFYYGDEIGIDGGHDPDNRKCMIWDETNWDKDMRDYHKKLIRLRRNSHALAHGGFQLIHAEGDVVAFQRQSEKQQLFIVGYRGADITDVTIPVWHGGLADGATLIDCMSEKAYTVRSGAIHFSAIHHGQALILEVQS